MIDISMVLNKFCDPYDEGYISLRNMRYSCLELLCNIYMRSSESIFLYWIIDFSMIYDCHWKIIYYLHINTRLKNIYMMYYYENAHSYYNKCIIIHKNTWFVCFHERISFYSIPSLKYRAYENWNLKTLVGFWSDPTVINVLNIFFYWQFIYF